MITPDSLYITNEGTLSPEQRLKWNDLQKELSTNEFQLISFEPAFKEESFWRLNVITKNKLNPFSNDQFKKFDYYPNEYKVNQVLDILFDKKFRPDKRFWGKFENYFKFKGLFIPTDDIRKLSKKELKASLQINALKARYFNFEEFIYAIKKRDERSEGINQNMINGLWEYFKSYSAFLNKLEQHQPEIFSEILPYLFPKIDGRNIKNCLFSEQVNALMWLSMKAQFLPKSDASKKLIKIFQNCHDAVQEFWDLYSTSINYRSFTGFKQDHEIKIQSEIKQILGIENGIGIHQAIEIEQAYFKLIKKDKDLIGINVVLANEFKFYLHPYFSQYFKKQGIKDKILQFFSKRNKFIEQVIDFGDYMMQEVSATYERRKTIKEIKKFKTWTSISFADRAIFQQEIINYSKEEKKHRIDSWVKEFWSKHLQRQINQLTAPFLIWDVFNPELSETYTPNWNILPPEEVGYLEEQYELKQALEKKELDLLEKRIATLVNYSDLNSLELFFKNSAGFGYSYIQENWESKYKSHYNKIKTRREFKIRRMQEFGILDFEHEFNAKKEIWLNEMLAIEEEVKPYIPYVKQAFSAAMPIKRTVEFDPYRHTHDGMEFDPSTFADQNKWMRGEIMKAHRNKVVRGEIIQINAFALDYSGSMDHERMRNLFKIIYLLVLGLENRKSYDAFNFFSTNFLEVADYEDNYTDRTVLFRILSHISKIVEDKVFYKGQGATNMSEGIIESHKRCINFGKALKTQFPRTEFLHALFVITDGRPTVGIIEPVDLNIKINELREVENIAIKGIYLKPEGEEPSEFMPIIFGKGEYIESNDFQTAINEFVQIMTATFKKQREELKEERKRRKRNSNLLT